MDNTVKHNRLIADFMGKKYESVKEFRANRIEARKNGVSYGSDDLYIDLDLKYNTSWDWLMPVVEKINSVCLESERLKGYFDNESNYMIFTYGDIYICGSVNNVHNEAINFIKWYNEQSK